MIDILAITDTETTGTDPKKDVVIEVALVLFSVRFAIPISSFSTLISTSKPNEARLINGIPDASLELGMTPQAAWAGVAKFAAKADAFIAHNAEFDRSFFPADLAATKPWICSYTDLAWPKSAKPGNLVKTALEHGLGIASAHRAMADCDTLSRLLTRINEMGTDLQSFLARGLRPKGQYQAIVSFADKDLAKDASFSWDTPTKRWLRTMAHEDVAALPFKVELVTA